MRPDNHMFGVAHSDFAELDVFLQHIKPKI